MARRPIHLIFRASMIGAGAAAAVLLADSLRDQAWSIYDSLQRAFPAKRAEGVALIVLDQASLDQFDAEDGYRFPLPRAIYGAVAKVAAAAAAKAVAYDIIFSEASSHNSYNPQAGPLEPLTCASPVYSDADDCVFSMTLKEAELPALAPAPSANGDIKAPYKLVHEGIAKLGSVSVEGEADGIFRRMPTQNLGPKGSIYPTLSQAMLETAFPERASSVSGDALLRFLPPHSFPQVSLYNAIRAFRALEDGQALPEEFAQLKDKVWLVGYTAGGLLDLKPTPTDPRAPGLVLHATALSNHLTGDHIRAATPLLIALLASVGGLLIFAPTGILRMPTTALGFGALGVIAIPAAITAAFWQFQVWVNPLVIGAGLVVTATANLSWRFQKEWRERLTLARNLEHAMSAEMVQMIRTGEVEVSRFGEKRELTILFSDLEGFTSISEYLDPAHLVEFMNAYFEDVVQLIFASRGYVDKFIGDAVMALWGAPVANSSHAKDALAAATQYYDAVQRFNLKVRETYPNFPSFASRVGLHTGLVIAGNIGSSRRYNYTAFGDSVNLASRLESLCKKYEVYVLVSEDTIRAADAERLPGIFEVDSVSVKGRQSATRIYSFASPSLADEFRHYAIGLAQYRNANWPEALKEFQAAPHLGPSRVMIARCQDAIENGPSLYWRQGVWSHDSK